MLISWGSRYTKANFGSAGVLLGLTPTILATIGSSTPELALLSSRRPVLTFLIVLGSPAVNSIRAFNFDRLITDFKALEGNEEMYFPNLSTSTTLKRTCVLVEFLVAFASVANLVQISLVINRNTISIMSCDNSDMLVELWIGLALITHGLGILTFRTRSPSVYRSVEHWLVNEFSPCASHHEENVAWNEKKTKWFVVFSWFASVFTILHLAFGTIMFSSLFFVGSYNLTTTTSVYGNNCLIENRDSICCVYHFQILHFGRCMSNDCCFWAVRNESEAEWYEPRGAWDRRYLVE